MFENIEGLESGWRKIEYNWRDVALYALAVGAEPDELSYYYEKDMKALPSFVTVPYYNAVHNEPQRPAPYPPNYYAADVMSREYGKKLFTGFHMGFQIEMHRELDPIKGSLVHNSVVDRLFDRGPGKGADLEVKQQVYDEAGNLIATNTSYHRMPEIGGFGGRPPVKKTVIYPEREPDLVENSYIGKVQNALYRLTGDTNRSHIDPDIAVTLDERGVFMQGLSSFGYACRMAIRALFPGRPELLKRMYVQMRSKAYPDTPVQLQIWKIREGYAVFRYIDRNSGKAILDYCEIEWNEKKIMEEKL